VTSRLYYEDSFLREFDAQVLSCAAAKDEGRFEVVLEATAFYPESGGQPSDRGRLAEANVLDVVEREDSTILHITDRKLPTGPVRGAIDWERRFDHIQQHTGQHLISAAFIELFNFPTVSFHLGREISTIDVAAPSLAPRHLEEAERRANQIIFEDRPIQVNYGTAEELADAGIRKAVDRTGPLRVVTIEGCDRQPCGGTHAARTGQVGLVLLRRFEKHKQNWRIEFVCGGRALRAARTDLATLSAAAELLSCGLPELPAMVGKALEERRESYRTAQRLLERLAEYEAEKLLATETVTADGRTDLRRAPGVIVRVFDDAEANYLRLLAARLVTSPGITALLGTRAGGHLVFAQSAAGRGDMGALLRECLASAGGKGGGAKDFAQGRVADVASLDGLLARAAAALNLGG